jgi:hypothetical protein
MRSRSSEGFTEKRPEPAAALSMRLVSHDWHCADCADALIGTGLPEWRGALAPRALGNATTSTFASPSDDQRRLHGHRHPSAPPRPAGQTPRLRRPARLPAGPAGRRLGRPPARHPPWHHPARHPPRHHRSPHLSAIPRESRIITKRQAMQWGPCSRRSRSQGSWAGQAGLAYTLGGRILQAARRVGGAVEGFSDPRGYRIGALPWPPRRWPCA